jgi:hypothetical protein
MLIALLFSLYAHAATPVETLTKDVQALIPKGDLVNFEVLKETRTNKSSELIYTISYVKSHSIVRQLTKARYEKQNGAWVLTQVAPLDRQIEFLNQ